MAKIPTVLPPLLALEGNSGHLYKACVHLACTSP